MILDLSAVCLMRNGCCLNVRKTGTDHFILPGGKIEPGETARAAAVREVAEELRLQLDPSLLQPLGTFQADAANGDAEGISCTVFLRDWDPSWPHPEPDHEIAE